MASATRRKWEKKSKITETSKDSDVQPSVLTKLQNKNKFSPGYD